MKRKITLMKNSTKLNALIYEVEEVVDLTPDTKMRDKAIIETLLHTGLRVSELVALNKNDIQVALARKVVLYCQKIIIKQYLYMLENQLQKENAMQE